ncbi:MAG: phosphoesterase [Pseudomonadota bacterium]
MAETNSSNEITNVERDTDQKSRIKLSRRNVLQGATAIAAVSGAGVGMTPQFAFAAAIPGNVFADAPNARRQDAFVIRRDRARENRNAAPLSVQPINNDEAWYPDFRGSFSKTLRHDANGLVRPNSYQSYINALNSRDSVDFDNILVGRQNDPNRVRLVSPQAAYAFEMSGLDGNANRINAAPDFESAVTEAEMAELYWYSITRDIPFSEYENRNIIQRAADDLNTFSRKDIFPRDGSGDVTPATLFRGTQPTANFTGTIPLGAEVGPFVSQFLLQPFQIGQLVVDQRYPKLERGGVNQFMTTFGEALAVQRGFDPNIAAGGNATTFTDRTRYIARMRDLSEWVHRDLPLQSPLHALSVVFGLGDDNAFDQSLPYLGVNSATQQGFATFGVADIFHLSVHGPRQALTGAWFQKWAAHRRLRPEAYGMRINRQVNGIINFGLGNELLASEGYERAVNEIRELNGTPGDSANDGLLPMGFPEGSPAHPAYPGGHSSFIAAGATVLKAFLNEDYVFQNPVVPNRNGSQLLPYAGPDLTIGGELNKLVGNVTHARDAAGMHWRSDGIGNFIGEAVGIALLADYTVTYNEEIDGMTLRKFDGQLIRINDGTVTNIPG